MGFILEFRDQPAASVFAMTPETALEFFRAKGLRPTFSYLDMIREEHDVAFTVAKMLQVDLLKTTQEAVQRAITEGWSIGKFRKELGPRLKAAGWWGRADVFDPRTGALAQDAQLGSAYRLNTIYRSNLQSAYSVGQWERIQENAEDAPWLLYDAVDDHRTRPEHARLDNTVLPVNDPFWDRFMPPNGYNCRCGVIQLTDADLERMGLRPSRRPKLEMVDWRNPRTGQIERIPAAVDPGWDHNPGADRLAKLQGLAREKIRTLPEEWQEDALASLQAQGPAYFADEGPDMEWHRAAFVDAPVALKKAVQNAKRIEVRQTKGKGAYAQAGRFVEMGSYSLDEPRGRSTWRHEFGHILDVQLAHLAPNMHGYYSSGRAWLAARDADSKALQEAAGRGRKSKAQQQRAADRAAAYERAREEAVKATGNDFVDLLEQKAKAANIALEEFVEAMIAETVIFRDTLDPGQLGAAGRNRLAQALEALARRDLEHFVSVLLHLDLPASDWRYKREIYNQAEALGSLSDLGGATTKNKVANYANGFPGHSSAYYRRASASPTEAFANITSLMGHPLRFWHEIARRFAPAQAKAWEELIEQLGDENQ